VLFSFASTVQYSLLLLNGAVCMCDVPFIAKNNAYLWAALNPHGKSCDKIWLIKDDGLSDHRKPRLSAMNKLSSHSGCRTCERTKSAVTRERGVIGVAS
jgi:hypothetical protein